jgi:Cu/Ag efflux pump CusA
MQPTLQIEVDLAAARRHGIKPGDVRRAAAALVAGIDVGSFFERQKVFQVVVRGTPDVRHSLTSVRRLLIDTPRGAHVRVGDVASVAIVPNPVDIRHDAVSRYVDVRADVRGRSLAAVQDDVRTRIEAMSFPLEYHAEVVEPADDVVPPPARFISFAIAAAIGIFLLLQAALNSWRLATLVSLVLPLGLVDGLLVAFANGGGISLGEAIGLFTVFAITARNAMMLIDRYQHLEREEQEPPGVALVLRGTRDRLPPILMTAIVTGVAMLPLAVLGNTAGNELTHGTALVVLGGLVTSTLLNLFILPALYLHYASRPRRTPDAAPAGPGARQPVPVTRVETTG